MKIFPVGVVGILLGGGLAQAQPPIPLQFDYQRLALGVGGGVAGTSNHDIEGGHLGMELTYSPWSFFPHLSAGMTRDFMETSAAPGSYYYGELGVWCVLYLGLGAGYRTLDPHPGTPMSSGTAAMHVSVAFDLPVYVPERENHMLPFFMYVSTYVRPIFLLGVDNSTLFEAGAMLKFSLHVKSGPSPWL